MRLNPSEIPMNPRVVAPLDFFGENDVTDALKEVLDSVELNTGSDEERIATISDVRTKLNETKRRVIAWSLGDPTYCSPQYTENFIDLALIELFDISADSPVSPEGLLLDVIYESETEWFPGFDTWNWSTVRNAQLMLLGARVKLEHCLGARTKKSHK
jgi:hypothetical protein